MSIGKKQRDAKFIIYQSLYIIVIALLGIKGVTLMDIPDRKSIPVGENKTPVDNDTLKALQDSLKVLSDLRLKYNFVSKWGPNDSNVTFDKLVYEVVRKNRGLPPPPPPGPNVSGLNSEIARLKALLRDCCGRNF